MKFLLTNDDGIDAAGLEALRTAAQTLGESVIVAPAGPQSGVSHRVTWQEGVRIEPRGDDRYAIHGTPADCVRLGLLKVVPDAKWILSGINHGANLGADVHYSGTVAAVREAVLHGWPGHRGLALPQIGYRVRLGTRREMGQPDPRRSARAPGRARPFYSINLPNLPPDSTNPEVIWCPLDPNPLPLNYRHEEESDLYFAGDYQLRHRAPGADVDVCFGGRIAITEVRLL